MHVVQHTTHGGIEMYVSSRPQYHRSKMNHTQNELVGNWVQAKCKGGELKCRLTWNNPKAPRASYAFVLSGPMKKRCATLSMVLCLLAL